MAKILAKAFKVMPSNSRITLPPRVRSECDIREGDLVKVWITDDEVVHIKKVVDCDGCADRNSSVSVNSIVGLLNGMSDEDKVKIIKGITPPCFVGGFSND